MVIALIYTVCLPESLPKSIRKRHDWKSCFVPYKSAFSVFLADDGTNRRWRIQLCTLVGAVVTANHIGLLTILPLYLLNSPLCFDRVEIAAVIVEIYSLRAVGSIVIPFVFRRSDTSLIIASLLSDICLYAMLGFLSSPLWIFIGRLALHVHVCCA